VGSLAAAEAAAAMQVDAERAGRLIDALVFERLVARTPDNTLQLP